MKRLILFLLITTLVLSCTKPLHTDPEPCGPATIIDPTIFGNTNTGNYTITNAVVNGGCLEIKLSASGCSGTTWVGELIDSEALIKTNPPQRMLKMKLTDNELCAAVFSKTFYFDISNLKVPGTDKVHLLLTGYTPVLTYQY